MKAPIVSRTLESVQIGAPTSAGGLTMYPLLAAQTVSYDYLLLDECLERGLAEVTELSEFGSVPKLRFHNKAPKDILLLHGEELIGAKQNRVLNLSIMVGPGQEIEIPVSCVEAGRWNWRSRRFSSSGHKLHSGARAEQMAGVSRAMGRSGERADPQIQAAVWSSIHGKLAAFQVASSTAALHDAYLATEPMLGAIRDAFEPIPEQVGATFAIGARFVGFDLYDCPQTLARLLPKLAGSYAFDALEERAPLSATSPSAQAVADLLKRFGEGTAQEHPAIAKGRDIRIEASALHAAALVVDDRVVHLAGFLASR